MGKSARKTRERDVEEARTGESVQNAWSEYEIDAQTSLVDRPLRN